MSRAQTWFACSMASPRSAYGNTGCAGCFLLVLGLRYIAWMPVIHNYRWGLGLAQGESRYDELERRLAQAPIISVPTITMGGDANGAFHAPPSSYAKRFAGPYAHRDLKGGIGHNLPQVEAPAAFAQAIKDVDRS